MKQKTVVVALYPGCISYEVALAAELLSKKYQIINATPDGQDLRDVTGLPLKTQISYAQINLDECVAILVPGGNPASLTNNKEIDRVLVEANKRNLLIAGICAGPSILAKAGILKGKKSAHGYQKEQLDFLKEIFQDVYLVDDLLAVDGNIITAKPEAHIDFAVEVASRLEAFNTPKPGKLKEYYRGTLGRKIRPLALALIKNKKGQFLLHQAYDSIKKEAFYRHLGGGIEFGETGREAVAREIEEELGLKTKVLRQITTVESIFTYEGKPGHEIVMLFEVEFTDSAAYQKQEFRIIESGRSVGKAVWRSPKEIQEEGAKLYPEILAEALGLPQ